MLDEDSEYLHPYVWITRKRLSCCLWGQNNEFKMLHNQSLRGVITYNNKYVARGEFNCHKNK
jgi:hypothetical protein